MTVIDAAVYAPDGQRAASVPDLSAVKDAVARVPGGFAWISLDGPDPADLDVLAAAFGIHGLTVEDALAGRQRPKLERYDDSLFLVLRPARYDDTDERVRIGEVHLFAAHDVVIVIRRGAASGSLTETRERVAGTPDTLGHGPLTVVHAVIDAVVDDYAPVVDGLTEDVDQIEEQLFTGDEAVARRIYDLSGEVLQFQRAVEPLGDMIATLRDDLHDEDAAVAELRHALRDVADHVTRLAGRTDVLRQKLQNALSVNATLVAQRQNDEMARLSETSLVQAEQAKKISSWAAILFAPSLVTGIYGMNFRHMPELAWTWGYAGALGVMVAFSVLLYVVFRSRHWL